MKQFWRSIRRYILPPIGYFLARAVGVTLRIEVRGADHLDQISGGKILAGWHGSTFVAANYFKGQGLWTIISKSRDGDMQDKIFRRFGFKTVRGSSGRGGARAVVESIRVLKSGETMAFTPDGPRGPKGVVQPGIMLMAKKSGAALIPAGIAADRRWFAPTWDSYMVPKPFARCVIQFGEPIYVPRSANEDEVEQLRLKLEADIHRNQAQADARMGHRVPEADDRD